LKKQQNTPEKQKFFRPGQMGKIARPRPAQAK